MHKRFEGKVALITGGGTGIGAACAERLAREGARVAVMGRRSEPLEETAQKIGGLAVAADASDQTACERAVGIVAKTYGGIDILVASAGIIREGSVTTMEIEAWRRTMDANLNAVMISARACIPVMRRRASAAIVAISSVGGLVAPGNMAAYVASKTAVIGLTRSLAVDYGPAGIRVNSLCPGWVWTPMSAMEMEQYAEARGISVQNAVDHATRHLPLQRMSSPGEIAACAAFLASDDASFVTGTVLVADGGSQAVDVGYVSLIS